MKNEYKTISLLVDVIIRLSIDISEKTDYQIWVERDYRCYAILVRAKFDGIIKYLTDYGWENQYAVMFLDIENLIYIIDCLFDLYKDGEKQ